MAGCSKPVHRSGLEVMVGRVQSAALPDARKQRLANSGVRGIHRFPGHKRHDRMLIRLRFVRDSQLLVGILLISAGCYLAYLSLKTDKNR